MKASERQLIAKTVVHFYSNIANFNKRETVRHFVAQGEHRVTIYRIIRRYEKKGTYEYEPKTGRKRTVASKIISKRVVNHLKNTNRSVRETALKFKISKSTIQNIKQREGVKTYKCVKASKMTEDQQKRAKINSRKILVKSAHKILVLDDETYVTVDPRDINGVKYYNCTDKSQVPNEVKFKGKQKFPKQFLIWQALDQCGHVSEAYIKMGTMNSKEYMEECLMKRLVPFIKKYHQIDKVMFWPDLAPIHYQKDVINCLKQNGIQFIDKSINIPGCPQARPIEIFWGKCKEMYSRLTFIPDSIKSFGKIWQKISSEKAESSGHTIMRGIRGKLRQISSGGAFTPLSSRNH